VLRLRRIFLYLALTLPLMPAQAILVLLGSRLAHKLPVFYHRRTSRILGFEVETVGTPSTHRPTLFVVNHVSYLDIEVLGGVIEGSFIAKREVAGWPLFGWLAKLQQTVFIERRAHTTHHQRDAILDRLRAGDNLILFPEGTSGDGNRVLPFKSALFGAVHGAHLEHPVAVQPVSLAYTRLDGMPLGRFFRPFFAWYGDMDMGSHLWAMLGLGQTGVVVEFHTPVSAESFPTRRAMADYCWRVVSAGVASALAGRPQPIEPTAAVRPLPVAEPAVPTIPVAKVANG